MLSGEIALKNNHYYYYLLLYENLYSTSNIGLALYYHTEFVVVTSNVTEHTESTGIYNSTSNVYLPSNHSLWISLHNFVKLSSSLRFFKIKLRMFFYINIDLLQNILNT